MGKIDKTPLPRITMLQDGMGNPRYASDEQGYAQHEVFKLADNWPLNEGWVLQQHGICVTLVYERDLTIAIMMGGWDEGSEAYALCSAAGCDEVGAYQDKYMMADAPEHLKDAGDLPAIIEQFYNHLIYEAMSSFLPDVAIDSSSHITV